ncbi:flavin-containing monooxygenase, partial [Aureobasidium melanogenum]|uniref:Flavin-containing monooxygenase n=1 Tax=Aureobasidium melanogenum (strain CBS 110374) TaxID=1043003 RepID=A0A074VP27_AURM1
MAAVQGPTFPTPVITSDQLKGNLPTVTIDENVDCAAIATSCIARLQNLQQSDLTDDALWRDSLSITEHQRTFNSATSIIAVWNELKARCQPHNFRLVPNTAMVFRLGPRPAWLTAAFTFETDGSHPAECSGRLNMVPDDSSDYKIWVFCTIIEALKDHDGHGNPDSLPDPKFAPAANLEVGGKIDCIIAGGGMAGLCAAGRLHALRIPYLVVERNASVGDNWTKRYDSMHLHLSNSYSEMPFQRVYLDKPYNLSSRDLADGMQKYVDMHNIQIWLSSSVDQARWDENTKSWTVTVSKQGQLCKFRAKHLVMAIGGGLDVPRLPKEYANRDEYQGTVLHSIDWKNADAFTGKKGVIIGSANSAFDIAKNMVDSNMSEITMVQRSTTHVISTKVFYPLIDPLYNPETDVGLSDRLMLTPPYAVGRLAIMAGATALQSQDPDHYSYLQAAGFKYHQSPDLLADALERFGGHVLDHGTVSSVFNSGKFKVKSGILPVSFTRTGLRFQDGSEVDADVIVLATGFRSNLRESVAAIVGSSTANCLDDFFGLDAEGEIRGLAKPIGHPGIWYLGGGTANARFHSRVLAMQIAADVRGRPFVPYTATP